jgi:hypothetical protein
VLAFPTNLAPIVGQQITLTASSSAAVGSRVHLFRQCADAGECDLIAKTEGFDVEVGFVYVGSGLFASDRRALPPINDAALRLLATHSGRPVTYTCVPPGSGERIGVDRDGDGYWDGDERANRSYRSGRPDQHALMTAREAAPRLCAPRGSNKGVEALNLCGEATY